MNKSCPLLLLIISVLSLTGCVLPAGGSRQYDYILLTEYSYTPATMHGGTKVRLLAFSGGKESDKEHVYYYQFIVVNEETGDTVRVLAPLISVDVEAGVESKTYSSPLQIKAEKQVNHATFEQIDSSLSLVIQTNSAFQNKEPDSDALTDIVNRSHSGQPMGNETVVINKSVALFENKRFKTAIGTLNFQQVPW